MDPLPLSLVNDYLFCPRRAGLKLLEGLRGVNEHTVKGDIVHERADTPGYHTARGVTVIRALPVWSERLGLSGICDIVEIHPGGGDSKFEISDLRREAPGDSKFEISDLKGAASGDSKFGISDLRSRTDGDLASGIPELRGRAEEAAQEPPDGNLKSEISNLKCTRSVQPVEFKKGPRRKFENDDVQVCAQAICLEEALGVRIERGAIFFAASKHRREIEMTAELRETTERTVEQLHALVASGVTPLAERKPACDRCSLIEDCLPSALRFKKGAAAWFSSSLKSERGVSDGEP